MKIEPNISSRFPFPNDYEFMPCSCILPKKYMQKVADRILNFGVRPDDVWVTHRFRTAWLSNIVWQSQHIFDCDHIFQEFKIKMFLK